MWCKFGHTTLNILRHQNPRTPPCSPLGRPTMLKLTRWVRSTNLSTLVRSSNTRGSWIAPAGTDSFRICQLYKSVIFDPTKLERLNEPLRQDRFGSFKDTAFLTECPPHAPLRVWCWQFDTNLEFGVKSLIKI